MREMTARCQTQKSDGGHFLLHDVNNQRRARGT
jgi:hypothetical protein